MTDVKVVKEKAILNLPKTFTKKWPLPLVLLSIVGLIVAALLISEVADIIKSGSWGDGGDGTDRSEKTTIATIECAPNEVLFDQTGGWCSSEVLEPGRYRVKVLSTSLRISSWEDGNIVGHYNIPWKGMPLTLWRGQQFDEFKQDFASSAPVNTLPNVGAPIAKINSGKPFDPVEKGFFQLKEAGRVSIGINQIPLRNFYEGNLGKLVVAIEGRPDEG